MMVTWSIICGGPTAASLLSNLHRSQFWEDDYIFEYILSAFKLYLVSFSLQPSSLRPGILLYTFTPNLLLAVKLASWSV